jgi:hypothetical protein
VGPNGVDLPVPWPANAASFVVRPADGWVIAVPPAEGVTVTPDDGGYRVTTGPGVRSVRVVIRPPEFGPK